MPFALAPDGRADALFPGVFRAGALPAPGFLAGAFLEGDFAAFFGEAFRLVPLADFRATFFVDFLPGFLAVFLALAFFEADFFVDFFAGFDRATDFFFDAFFAEDFFVLIRDFLPADFLLAVDLRDEAAFLLAPARFCFLLAAFFAGMFHSCRSEKNAELYIGWLDLEALEHPLFPGPEAIFKLSAAVGRRGFQSAESRLEPNRVRSDVTRRIEWLEQRFDGHDVMRIRRRRGVNQSLPGSSSHHGDNRFIRRITLH